MRLRRRPFTYAPPPAEVLSPAELARREQEVRDVAAYWLLEPREARGVLFMRRLIETGRIGEGDRN